MIDRATIDRIFAAMDITDIVGEFVTLRKAGVNLKACCPFHQEKTPSFVVSPAKGLYKCFGCGKSGNAVNFIMEHEGMSYPEALKYIAAKYGIEVREEEMSPERKSENDKRENMMALNSWAGQWLSDTLNGTDEGLSVGLGYFRSRGFTDATVRKFGLGYCPSSGDAMTKAALAAGHREETLTETGLTILRENGTCYDRFCGRVTFPIHNIAGRIIGFGGRVLKKSDRTAKYLNSPESQIYNKSNTLYGIFQSKGAIMRENCCILVEGYTDVIQMHQSGIENVVASSGTSLTENQVRLIKRFTGNITVIYDGDAAGIKASLRGIDMILREGLNVRVVPLPEQDDPDSFARSRSSEQIREYIRDNEEDFIRFKTRMLMSDAGDDPTRRSETIESIVTSISVIPDDIRRAVFIQDCARLSGIGERTLTDAVNRLRLTGRFGAQAAREITGQPAYRNAMTERDTYARSQSGEAAPSAGSNTRELEREIVGYLLKYGPRYFEYSDGVRKSRFNVAQIIISELDRDSIEMRDEGCRAVYAAYRKRFAELGEGADIPVSEMVSNPDPAVSATATDILTEDWKYEKSRFWEKHDVFVEDDGNRLDRIVIKTLTIYKTKSVEDIIASLHDRLSEGGLQESEEAEILQRISSLNEIRRQISQKVSRPII